MELEFPDGWDKSRDDVLIPTIKKIQDAFASGKKYVILSASTGIGKSWIAATLAINHKKRTFILTKQRSLQDQYVKEFPFAYSVKGKGNWPCIQNYCETTCHEGECDECVNQCVTDDFKLLDEGTKKERIQLESFSQFKDPKQTINDAIKNYGTFSELDRIQGVKTITARELIDRSEKNLAEIDKTQWFLIKYKTHIYWVNEDDQIPEQSELLSVPIILSEQQKVSEEVQTTIEDYLTDVQRTEDQPIELPYVLENSVCPYWYQRRMGEKATVSIWTYASFMHIQLVNLEKERENADKLLRKLKSWNYNASIINGGNLNRVAYSSYTTREEAIIALEKIRIANQSAWLLTN